MTRDEIFKAVAQVLNKTFEIPLEDISQESNLLDDFDLDSIDAVDLIIKLQKYTTKNIDPEEFKQIRTVNDIVDAIEAIVIDEQVH